MIIEIKAKIEGDEGSYAIEGKKIGLEVVEGCIPNKEMIRLIVDDVKYLVSLNEIALITNMFMELRK